MNWAPVARAAPSSATVRRVSSFGWASSRACCSGTFGMPKTWSRLRTGGGPPSTDLALEKKRETEKVEQGGDAKTHAQ
eukprot:2206284-Pleurochrysis_carterae.AAC.5